jgi:hypothetical protein
MGNYYYTGSLDGNYAGANPAVRVYMSLDPWVPAPALSSVKITVHLKVPTAAGSTTLVAAPAGIPIHADFTNSTTPLRSSYANEYTDATGTCVFYLPGDFFNLPDTYKLTVAVVPVTIGGIDYIIGDSGYNSTFIVTPAILETTTTVALYQGGDAAKPLALTVHPGDMLWVEAVVTSGGNVVPYADVGMTITFADGSIGPGGIVNTGANGVGWLDMSEILAATTNSSQGFGNWTITGEFPGLAPAGMMPGFYASASPGAFWQNDPYIDDPGFYYENAEFANYIHGAHGTPYLPGGADVEVGRPTTVYGMADPGDVYGYNYWGVPTIAPVWNDYGDPQSERGSGYGNTYVDTNVTDRSGGVMDTIQNAQNPNQYRPNAQVFGPEPYGIPGYQGDPQFNNYGNSYVDTNVTDRSQPMVYGLQAQQNPNFYRNGMTLDNSPVATYYAPMAPDDVLTNPVYTMFANEPNGLYSGPRDTARKVCKTY